MFERLSKKLKSIYELEGRDGRLASMEGYRGLAILLVLFVHLHEIFGAYLGRDSGLWRASHILGDVGNSGVDLFFVASGYLIYGACIRRPVRYGAFTARRVERIFPTFLVVLTIYLAASALAPQRSKIPSPFFFDGLGFVAANAFLLPGMLDITAIITPAWSLSYEFFFYLTVPLLVAGLGLRSWESRRRVLLFLALTVVFSLFSWLVYPERFRLVMFLGGMLLYEAMHHTDWAKGATRAWETAAIVAFAAAFPLIAWMYNVDPPIPGVSRYVVTVQLLTMVPFAFFCFAVTGATKRVFTFTPLRWLGNISYSYYLIHGLTLNVVGLVFAKFAPPTHPRPLVYLAGVAVAVVATIVTATLLFVAVERRFSLNVRDRVRA